MWSFRRSAFVAFYYVTLNLAIREPHKVDASTLHSEKDGVRAEAEFTCFRHGGFNIKIYAWLGRPSIWNQPRLVDCNGNWDEKTRTVTGPTSAPPSITCDNWVRCPRWSHLNRREAIVGEMRRWLPICPRIGSWVTGWSRSSQIRNGVCTPITIVVDNG